MRVTQFLWDWAAAFAVAMVILCLAMTVIIAAVAFVGWVWPAPWLAPKIPFIFRLLVVASALFGFSFALSEQEP